MSRLGKEDGLTDRIYEAAIFPELWPNVLDNLSHAISSAGGILFAASAGEIRWTSSPGTFEFMRAFVDGGWDKRNSRAARLAPMKYPGFVHDLDIFTREEIDRDPFYTELCRPKGVGWAAGTIVNVPNGDMMVYSFDRSMDAGPYDRPAIEFLDTLRPHLARAGLMAARLHLERAKSAVDTLAAVGLPAAVLRSEGRAVAANRLLEDLTPHVRICAFDRMHLVSKRADAMFAAGLRQIEKLPSMRPLSFASRGLDDERAVIHLLPLRRRAHDIFNSAACIVLITPVAKLNPPAEALLRGLFDLTPAEAKVAHALGSGATPRAIARDLGVSYETVRNHLKTVLAKTGSHRQANLLGLLATTSLPRANGEPVRSEPVA
ncbi:MAG: helix-turn-helix transcriptional regulator [Mesorhizobium sp.]|uniref:helix-turn-helix transcriptional regulator n=1 Tax=Mesorhizobium sp. TaxID=1871066 RepID=UPI000FE8D87F|nr:helix-turn-helix transcriptional regulator [Mesorhizobium sp.]RWB14353.1 MAG: helix-turn-helix transcriptional regulator [Mesorhizobium sp.]